MIQRVQTVYLTIALILSILTYIFPLASFGYGMIDVSIYMVGVKGLEGYTYDGIGFYAITILMSLVITAILVSIFTYKKRPLQMTICFIAFFLNMAFIAASFIFIGKLSTDLVAKSLEYEIAVYFPLISLLMLMLAHRAIKKDEMMIRSMNRLR